jgi:HSP20 family protein
MARKSKTPPQGAVPGMRSAFDSFFSSPRPFFSLSSGVWSPPADVYETPDELVVKIEVAGIDVEDMDVAFRNDHLVIRGRRSDASRSSETRMHNVEVRYGEFERVFHLPLKIKTDEIQAEYDRGFLIVRAPKSAAVHKQIPIDVEDN